MRKAAIGLVLLAWIALPSARAGAEAPRTAVLDFTLAHAPGSLDPAVVDFSRAVQAQLLATNVQTWVERQEFERIAREADLGGISGSDAAAAVRLGHLLRADLLLRGEIAQRPAGAAELTLEVIDLKRAEVLATQAVPVAMNARQRLHPSAAEVTAATSAALAALEEARSRLEQFKNLRVLAPLHFRNVGKSGRLDFLEARLKTALDKAAATATGFRALRFPRTGEAGEESSLVLAGLTDTNPEAWQQVADAYVWGEFAEEGADGMVFEDVPVTITLQVWTGTGEPREVKARGAVKTLDADLAALAGRVLAELAGTAAGGARSSAERQRVAGALRQRANEVARQLGTSPALIQSATGRQLYAHRMRLLEIACFFDPLNRALQEERLGATWGGQNPFQPLGTLRGQWLRVADYRVQAARFLRQADGGLDPQWSIARERHLREFIDLLEKSAWRTKEMQVSQEEVHRQLRAIVGQWSELLAETHRAVQNEPRVPAWYAAQRTEWFTRAWFLQHIHDPIIVHDALEKTWVIWEPEMGRLLKDPGPDKAEVAQRWIEELFSVCGALGDHDRATAMLDSAWRQGVVNQAERVDGEKPRPPPPPRVDQAWAPRSSPSRGMQPFPTPVQPAFPVLEAAVREVDPRTIRHFTRARSIDEELFRKNTRARVEAITWQKGRLWIAEGNEELPAGLGPKNPQGDHYVWSYDPALRLAELITPKLGGHSAVSTLLPVDDTLWIGFEADGVWRLDGPGAVQRYQGEDGLQTMQTKHAATDGKELFYLGGTVLDPLISSFSLKDGKWSGLQVPRPSPMPEWLARLPAGATLEQPHRLAVCGEWLCFSGAWTAFYNRGTRQWVDLQLVGSGPAGSFTGTYGEISADARGFWLVNGSFEAGVLWFVDPARPQEKRRIQLPGGTPRAVAHDGSRMLILLDAGGARSRLAVVDKETFTCIGQIILPLQNGGSLTVGDGRAWVGGWKQPLDSGGWDGGYALVEVDLPNAGAAGAAELPGRAQDFPLLRAVWSGDSTTVSAVLGGKPDLNATAASGWTALMGAVAAGRGDLVRLLLEAGADPNRLSREGESALQLAVARGEAEGVRLLLQHRAQANLRVPASLRGFSVPPRPQLEPAGARPATMPNQPANVKASATPEGEVALTWEDRADNETYYEICYKNSYGMVMVVARLPADSTRWVDPAVRDEARLVYTVEAINELSGETTESRQVEAKIVRPAPAENVFHSQYGFSAGMSEILPLRFLAQTPLATAARNGRIDLIELLLAGGADPNQPDAAGYTPLLHAVRHRQYPAARLLLAKGARPDWISATGESAAGLTYQWHEDEKLLEDLIRAMPSGPRAQEATMLAYEAATQGQIRDLEKLRALGGDLGGRIAAGDTPLRCALARDQVETAQWLLTQLAPELGPRLHRERLSDQESGMIEAAVANNRPEIFSRLLDLGLSVDQDMNDKPLAVIAAKGKAFAVFVLLRDRGADLGQRSNGIEIGDRGDGTVASYLTPEEARRYLGPAAAQAASGTWRLPGGFTISSPGPKQFMWEPNPAKLDVNAALIAACQKGSLAAVLQAAAAGAELDCHGAEGRTPLLEALKAGAFDVVRWLVEEGASVNRPSKAGFSPVAFAVGSGKPAEVDYLLQAGADPNLYGDGGVPPLALAAQAGNLDMIRQLLAAGANPNVSAYVRGRRENALAIALWKGDAGAVDLLLAAGANPRGQTYAFIGNTKAKGGVTKRPQPSLLMFAATGRNVALVKQMVSLGQNPKLKTDGGYDALAWAAAADARDVVEYLLPLAESKGRALESAREKGHTGIVQMLEKAGYQSP